MVLISLVIISSILQQQQRKLIVNSLRIQLIIIAWQLTEYIISSTMLFVVHATFTIHLLALKGKGLSEGRLLIEDGRLHQLEALGRPKRLPHVIVNGPHGVLALPFEQPLVVPALARHVKVGKRRLVPLDPVVRD